MINCLPALTINPEVGARPRQAVTSLKRSAEKIMSLDQLPQDANGDAIRRVISHGSELSRPMVVDFCVELVCITDAERFAKLAEKNGYSTKVEIDGDFNSFTCYCSKSMLLTYDQVVSSQKELDKLADGMDGWADGWGTLGNAKFIPE